MALVEASKILRKHLSPFVQYFELGSDVASEEAVAGLQDANRAMIDPELQQKLNMSIQELDLSVRANNCLESAKIGVRPRPGQEDRRRPAQGPQLRQDQPAGGQAEAGRHGPEPGHGPGRGRADRGRHHADDDDDDDLGDDEDDDDQPTDGEEAEASA